MIDDDFTLLQPFVDELENMTDEVADLWISRDRVTKTLIAHQMSPKFFRNHFGIKIYEYFLEVIKGNEQSGNCPVVHVMLHFCEGKKIKLPEMYMICSELKNIVLFNFTRKMSVNVGDIVFWKLADLLDINFTGVISEYMESNCEVIYGCKEKCDAKQAATKVELEVPQKEVNHRLKDIRFSKQERYDSESLFEMLDDTVIDKIERFLDDLNEILLTFYDIEEVDAEESMRLMQPVVEVLEGFYKLIDTLVVFPVMVNTFENLSIFLSQLSVEEYNQKDKKELLMLHLIGVVNDLEKWMDIVFIQRIADDVHYLDASFANNVVEIESLFVEQEMSDEDEDDLEFF